MKGGIYVEQIENLAKMERHLKGTYQLKMLIKNKNISQDILTNFKF